METARIFSAAQHVPELCGEAYREIAPHDELFLKLKQQYLEVDIRDRELETILDYLNSKDDEITALKNILIETDESEMTYAHEMERSQKLRKETKELALKVAQLCKRNVAAKQELDELMTTAHPDELAELEKQQWYTRVTQLTVGLSGVSVQSCGENKLVLAVVPREVEGLEGAPSTYRLTVNFDSASLSLQSLELQPADVSVDDLLFVSPTVTSIHLVISELQSRLHGHRRLQREIAKLSKRFGVAVVGEREFAVTFSTGTICRLHVGTDYPRPYASIYITGVEGHLPPTLATRLQDEKNRRVQGVTLKKLLTTFEQGLVAGI